MERGLRGKEVRRERNEKEREKCEPRVMGIVIEKVISQLGLALKFTTELCVRCLETVSGAPVTPVTD